MLTISTCSLVLACGLGAPETPPTSGGDAAGSAAPAPSIAMSEKASFAFGNERLHEDSEILWPGFLNGMRGFEHFYNPVGNPLYFESPLVNTGARLLYLHHEFADGSALKGGDLDVLAAQARLAVTDRLGIIATKDGYSWLDTGITSDEEGWNDIAIGAKYALWADRESDFVGTLGLRWQWGNGDNEVLQGHSQEISPFFSIAKGFDRFHIMANLTGRLPFDGDDNNSIIQWDVHFDYEIAPEALPGFAPLLEFHGLHYLDDADRTPLDVGGADYTNLGSTDVSGSVVVWSGLGARWKLSPHFSIGGAYEIALTNINADIFEDRVTLDLELTW